MRFILAALLFLSSSCATGPDIKVAYWHNDSKSDGTLPAYFDEISDTIGLPIVEASVDTPGVILIVRAPVDKARAPRSYAGVAFWIGVCGGRFVVTNGSKYVTAHEIGHALGLPHSKDPRNTMYYRPAVLHFEPWQLNKMHRMAQKLSRCLPRR